MLHIPFTGVVLPEIAVLGAATVLFFLIIFFSFRDSIAVLFAFYPAFFMHPYLAETVENLPFVRLYPDDIGAFFIIYLVSLGLCIAIFRSWVSLSITPRIIDAFLLGLAFVLLYATAFFEGSLSGLFELVGITLTDVWQQICIVLPLVIVFFISIT